MSEFTNWLKGGNDIHIHKSLDPAGKGGLSIQNLVMKNPSGNISAIPQGNYGLLDQVVTKNSRRVDINKKPKLQIIKSVENNLIDVEKLEAQIQAYLDQDKEKIFHLSKDNIEDLHIAIGDTKFFQYLTNMVTVTDEKGKEYVYSFIETFTPDKETARKIEKSQIGKSVDIVNYIKDKIFEFRKKNLGKDVSYIVLSNKSLGELERNIYKKDPYAAGVYVANTQYTKFTFHGYDILINPAISSDEHFVEIV